MKLETFLKPTNNKVVLFLLLLLLAFLSGRVAFGFSFLGPFFPAFWTVIIAYIISCAVIYLLDQGKKRR